MTLVLSTPFLRVSPGRFASCCFFMLYFCVSRLFCFVCSCVRGVSLFLFVAAFHASSVLNYLFAHHVRVEPARTWFVAGPLDFLENKSSLASLGHASVCLTEPGPDASIWDPTQSAVSPPHCPFPAPPLPPLLVDRVPQNHPAHSVHASPPTSPPLFTLGCTRLPPAPLRQSRSPGGRGSAAASPPRTRPRILPTG